MNISPKDIMVFIDIPYPGLYNNELFKPTSKLNRDNDLSPFILLRERLSERGFSTNTADYLLNGTISGRINIYVAMGITTNYEKLVGRNEVLLQSYYILEPPVVDPYSYNDVDNLTKCFDNVYIHNIDGSGYERHFHSQPNLRKFYTPQTKHGIIETLWKQRGRDFLVMINANKARAPFFQLKKGQSPISLRILINKTPGLKGNELYSERIRALTALHKLGGIDLYGYGWDMSIREILRDMPSHPFYFPHMYWKHRKTLKTIYKGSVSSKYEPLSRYKFCVCFENMLMPGWITEKIFDCFYVGTVPIYLGAQDIEANIPKSCFVDMLDFKDYKELYTHLSTMSDEEIQSYRESGRDFLSSEEFIPFSKETFVEQFEVDLMQTLETNGMHITGLQNMSSQSYISRKENR